MSVSMLDLTAIAHMYRIIDLRAAAAICAIVLLSIFSARRLWNAFFSDLARVPGPWHAKLTSFYLQWTMIRGRRCHWVHGLHAYYGSIVRIGPDEVAICDAAATEEIHSVSSPFLKIEIPGTPVSNLFAMTDPATHATRRRFYAKLFSQTSIRQNWEEKVCRKAHQAIGKIRRDAEKDGVVDVYHWFMLMANDIVSMLTIGEDHDLMAGESHVDAVMTANELHQMVSWAQFCLPLFLLLRMLSPFSSRLDAVFRCDRRLLAFGQRATRQTRKAQDGDAPQNFLAMALQHASHDKRLVEGGDAELRDIDIAMDAAGFQLAAAETVGATLTFLIWRVLGQRALQQRLEDEVASLEEVTDASCEKLPFLNAVIDETLRLHGAAPTALRRSVPRGGAVLVGQYIPEGKVVMTQAWSIHRDERLWPSPLSFDPDRWLATSAPGRTIGSFMPFGGGSRICAGIHLARMEIRLATASFFRRCRGAHLAPSVTPDSMQVLDRFNTEPVARRCEIIVG